MVMQGPANILKFNGRWLMSPRRRYVWKCRGRCGN